MNMCLAGKIKGYSESRQWAKDLPEKDQQQWTDR